MRCWLFVLILACKRESAATDAAAPVVLGDARHGRELMIEFECTRCHALAALDTPPHEKACTGCHSDIVRSSVAGTPAQIARWKSNVAELADVPSLESAGSRLRRDWIRGFLLKPHDLRPNLVPTMPRLALSESEALDVATYLSPLDSPSESDPLSDANADRGRVLAGAMGCSACHRFTGAARFSGSLLPTDMRIADLPRATRLAPDLRYTRDRFRKRALAEWLEHPSAQKSDTLMPDFLFRKMTRATLRRSS